MIFNDTPTVLPPSASETGERGGCSRAVICSAATNVVALSGGKDSTAMALMLAEREPATYTYVCTPTGDELPAMHAHWKRLEDELQSPILHLPKMTLAQLIREMKMLPNFRARFCTRLLKIVPFEAWIMQHLPAVAYVGLRADEETREGAIYGIELLIRSRYPLREWGLKRSDVLAYLAKRAITVPERTDCARCPLQSLHEWWRLWKHHPEIYEDACRDEDQLQHTYRSPGRDTWPASLRELSARFAAGEVPKDRRRQDGSCRVCTM